MPKNMGMLDRVIRLLIGLGLFAYVFVVGPFEDGDWGWLRIVMTGVGAIMVLTSVVSFCPLYPILGIKTCKSK